MREQDMRLRVFRFLKARMRNMIMPATVGIGLAVGGCAKEGVSAADSAAPADTTVASHDTQAQPRFDVPADLPNGPEAPADMLADVAAHDTAPDTSVGKPDAPGDTRDVAPGDQAVAIDGGSDTAGIDVGGMKYVAPLPDAGPELGGMKYIAPFFDAAVDATDGKSEQDTASGADAMVVRYAVVIPREDALIAVPLYMAPPPQDT